MSTQVKDAIVQEVKTHKKPRWYQAIIVDQHTHICHDGLTQLLAIVKAEQGQMCWIARADDFHFSEASVERTAQGYQLVQRKMDTVETTPLTIPVTIIGPDACRSISADARYLLLHSRRNPGHPGYRVPCAI